MKTETILWIIYISTSLLTLLLWIWDLYIHKYSKYEKQRENHFDLQLSEFDVIFSLIMVSFVPILNLLLMTISLIDLCRYYFYFKKQLNE